jgi:N-acetylglucosaminyl-diphospho-decaprenol L-rhamnosyltransferase
VIPQLSVIVLNYNGRAWLAACLDALAAQKGAPPFEVLFVDNGSTDGSIAFVSEAYPDVRVIDNRNNLGFAEGNNAGARAARGTILTFLNNDTVAAPDWLATLHRALLEHPECALVTSRLVSLTKPDVIDSAGDGYLVAGGAFKRGHGAPAAAFSQSREVFGACGAAFMVRREVFEQLGGFDTDFFMVYEDVDLSYRARAAGHRCWYAADAIVRHAGSGTLGTLSDMAVFYGQRNLEWTWLKNTPSGLLLRTLPAHVVYSLAGLAHYVVKGRGGAALRGKVAALASLPTVLRKRKAVQESRRATPGALEGAMDRRWWRIKRAEKAGAAG